MNALPYPDQDPADLRAQAFAGMELRIMAAHHKAMKAHGLLVQARKNPDRRAYEAARLAYDRASDGFANLVRETFVGLRRDMERVPVIHDREAP